MATQAQLQKHFEGLLGHPIGDFDDVVLLRERTSRDVLEQEGEVVSRKIGTTGSSTKGCGRSSLIDVGGLSSPMALVRRSSC